MFYQEDTNSVKVSCIVYGGLYDCDMWSERDRLESNITPKLLAFCAGETRLPRNLITKCERSCL